MSGTVTEPHDSDSCAEIDSRLDDVIDDLNSICMWIARRGIKMERYEGSGSFNYYKAFDQILAGEATAADIQTASGARLLRQNLWETLGIRPCNDAEVLAKIRELMSGA
ncbi:MAG: hypothetical protein WC054_01355 [Candidatus Nanopelagicales bacterium]